MNNRAMVLDVESTGVSDDAQATELGWCDVHFDENGVLQPSLGKAFVQRCKPELPISFGAMAISHIYDDELVNEPSHRDVINNVVNDSVTYVIGHNIDYDMKVISNAGQNRQYKRICSLAIAQACYPFDTDHKLLAMCHMLDYDFARKHSKNAHNAKFDVMFCVRILRIMCMHNNITNMEQLYQFSEFCRIPQYMRFGKHKGMAIDEVPLGYKRYLLDKGVKDPYLKIGLERSIAKNLADIDESNRVKAEEKRLAAEQKQAQDYQQPGLLPQEPIPPYTDEIIEPQNAPETAQEAPNNANDTLVAKSDEEAAEHTPGSNTEDVGDLKPDAINNVTNEGADELPGSNDKVLEPSDTAQKDADIKTKGSGKTSESGKKESKTKPAKKTKKKPSSCTAPSLDDIPPSFLSDDHENKDDVVRTSMSAPEQDDDFYKNPTSYDPMSKPSKADPLHKKKEVSTDPYGNVSGSNSPQ